MIASQTRILGFFIALVAAVPTAFCGLTWENTTVTQSVRMSEGKATGLFRFRNAGDMAITITAVRPACGCTTVDLPKKTYAPGEGGELAAIYEFGTSNGGKQHKTITVTTDDSASGDVELNFDVTIIEELEYSPRLLLWRMGDSVSEKVVTFRSHADRKIAAVEIASIEPKAAAIVRIAAQSDGYQILAHPVTTLQTQQVAVSGTVTLENGVRLPFSVYVLVR